MLLNMSNSDLTDLGRDIDALLKRRGWSQRRLAEEAGIDVSNISRIMRGIQEPSHKMIEAIADALQVDVAYLKKRAGLRVSTSDVERDPTVEYIAQRLERLPAELREKAVDALGAQLDTIYEIAGIEREDRRPEPSPQEEYEALKAELEDILLKLRDIRPDIVTEVVEGLLDEGRRSTGDDTKPGPPRGGQRRAS